MINDIMFTIFFIHLMWTKQLEGPKSEFIVHPMFHNSFEKVTSDGRQVNLMDPCDRIQGLLDQVLILHANLSHRVLAPSVAAQKNTNSSWWYIVWIVNNLDGKVGDSVTPSDLSSQVLFPEPSVKGQEDLC